jgi:capsular exopolysaccharide synthesis family protein
MTTPNLPAPLSSPPTVDSGGAGSRHALSRAIADPRFADQEGGIDWRRLVTTLLRFKWPILAVTLLGTAAGVALTRVLGPEYVAQATIWIDQSDRRGAEPAPIRPVQLLHSEAWVDLLQSYVVLDQVVHDQRLFLKPKSRRDTVTLAALRVTDQYQPGDYRLSVDDAGRTWTLATERGIELDHGAVGDSIGARVGLVWAPTREALPPGKSVEFTLATLRDAARRLKQDLDVQPPFNGNFLRLQLSGFDPVRITAIVNTVAERYVAVAAELKHEKLIELTKILDEQLSSARQSLNDAELALEAFRVRTITLPPDRAAPGAEAARDPAYKGFFDAQIERDAAQRDGEALERLLAQAGDSGLSTEALGAIGSVANSAELKETLSELTKKQTDLRAMRYGYTDAYPPVQRLQADIATLQRQTIPALTRALAAQLGARRTELDRRIEIDSRSLRQIPPRAIEEARLRRNVQLGETLYSTLKQRYEEARLADASAFPDVRILDSAVVPQRPVKNWSARIVLLAFFGSLGLAVVGAVLIDRVDPRVRYPDQVSREMGLTILGAVPHFKGRSANNDRVGRTPEEIAEVVEALRGVCLNLVYAYGAAGPMLVTITSPGAGDGKSFLASNLAHTFAEGGRRTLLVDADIRRGVLHRRLTARRRPGLTECLRGEVPFEAIVQETPYPALTLIGCGTRAHNAPELLTSPAMAQLINRVRPAYDVIIVDSPPLAGGVDPFVLGTLTGNLLMVLRTGYSHRDMAAAKLEVLDRLPVRLLGAVLNDVPPEAGYRYYYSYYLPGYEASDEPAEGRTLVIQ